MVEGGGAAGMKTEGSGGGTGSTARRRSSWRAFSVLQVLFPDPRACVVVCGAELASQCEGGGRRRRKKYSTWKKKLEKKIEVL